MMLKAGVVVSLLLLLTDSSTAADKPNIILIVADDVGWYDVGFHGSDQVQTPNIDALAYSGIILNQHYVQPTCTPTRSALLAGRYPSNMGMQGIPIGGSEPRGLPPARLLPEHLKDLGYTTRMVGKWHLGFYRKELTPTYRGFDSFLGYMNGLISYYDHIYQDLIPLKPIKESLASNRATSGKAPAISFEGGQLSGLDFFRNLTPAWDLSGRYATDVFTEEAVRIITTHDTAQPLFLYLSHLACHAGNRGKLLEAPQEVIDRFPHIIEPNRKTFAAMMWKLDESVGKVVAALRDRDMLQNSVILFISDNGAPTLPVGAWPNWGSNYPLRGLKLTQWEGGVRGVGALWSAGLGTPRVSSQLVHVTDWLPTLYRAAGGDPERLQKLDGVDQWNALLHDKPSKRSDALLYVDEMRKVWGVRSDRWKLVGGSNQGGMFDGYSGEIGLSPKSPAYDDTAVLRSDVAKALSAVKSTMDAASLQQLRSKATVKCPEQVNRTVCDLVKNPEPCLFDIDIDPCEANNLAESHPQEVSRLTKLYEALTVNLVPQLNAPYDVVNADPARFGNAWLPWEGTCDRDCNVASRETAQRPGSTCNIVEFLFNAHLVCHVGNREKLLEVPEEIIYFPA